jgi:uncharacterized protein (UPF0335 family)
MTMQTITADEASHIHDALNNRRRTVTSDGVAADRLRSIVDRIERLEGERKVFGDDIKDIYAEAKSAGFDVKVLRQLIALRRKDDEEVAEMETILDVYKRSLGM